MNVNAFWCDGVTIHSVFPENSWNLVIGPPADKNSSDKLTIYTSRESFMQLYKALPKNDNFMCMRLNEPALLAPHEADYFVETCYYKSVYGGVPPAPEPAEEPPAMEF